MLVTFAHSIFNISTIMANIQFCLFMMLAEKTEIFRIFQDEIKINVRFINFQDIKSS